MLVLVLLLSLMTNKIQADKCENSGAIIIIINVQNRSLSHTRTKQVNGKGQNSTPRHTKTP